MLLLLACELGTPDSPGPPDTMAADDSADSAADSDGDTESPVSDADGDGSPDDEDCNDSDPTVHPGAAEGCDGVDKDCDGMVNEGCGTAPMGTFDLATVTRIAVTGAAVGAVGDANGDGFADVWIGGGLPVGDEWEAGGWLLFSPISAVVDLQEDWDARRLNIEGPQAEDAEGVGDVDGDGLPDVAFSDSDDALGVFHSPVVGDGSAYDAELLISYFDNNHPGLVRAAGDQNQDGIGDLLVTSWDPSGADATAGILFSPALGAVNSGDWDVQFGLIDTERGLCSVAEGLGDVDGDGIDDIALGEGDDGDYGYCAYGAQALWVVPGPLENDVIVSEPGARFAPGTVTYDNVVYAVTAVPDAGGDGRPDLAVAGLGDDGVPTVWLVPADGAGALFPDIAIATLTSSDPEHDGLTHVEDAGDVNADGFGDLVISGYDLDGRNSEDPGGAWIAYGPFSGGVDLVSNGALLVDYGGTVRVGEDVAGVGDTNGDGFDDVLIGSLPFDDIGAAWLVYGGL